MNDARTHPAFWRVCALILLISLPARFALLGTSLWLDEAWVANSLLTPSIREMLYFDRWTQSSPPLFLVAARAFAQVAGDSEAALRITPLAASLCGLAVTAVVLRRLLSTPAALIGIALAASNYWVIKYGQQVKQYGSDLLSAAVMLLVLEMMIRRGAGTRSLLLVGLTGAIAAFASFPAMFWFPSCVAACALADSDRRRGLARAGLLALWLGACLAILYFSFLQPNMDPRQFRSLAQEFFDARHPISSLLSLHRSFGALLIPVSNSLTMPATWLAAAILVFGAARSLRGSMRSDRAALAVLLGCALPIVVAVTISAAKLYPLFTFSRFLIWSVPCCAVLIGYAVEPAIRRWESHHTGRLIRFGVPAACLGAVLLSQFIVFAFPRPFEQNRDAVEFMRTHAREADVLYVHGGMREQFLYYRRLLSWNSGEVQHGITGWPCCALDPAGRRSKDVKTLASDVEIAAAAASNRTLWLLLPAGSPGHWSQGMRPRIDELGANLEKRGCRQERRQPFGQTLVLAFSCD